MLDRRLRVVIFDLFGTLVSPFSRKQNEQLLTEMAAVLSVDRVGFARMWNYDTVFDRVTGFFPTIGDNVEHICRSLGVRVDEASLKAVARIRVEHTRADARTEAGCGRDAYSVEGVGIHGWIAQQLFRGRAACLARNSVRSFAGESGLLLLGGSEEARSWHLRGGLSRIERRAGRLSLCRRRE